MDPYVGAKRSIRAGEAADMSTSRTGKELKRAAQMSIEDTSTVWEIGWLSRSKCFCLLYCISGFHYVVVTNDFGTQFIDCGESQVNRLVVWSQSPA
jgi:hypothetical protein